MESDLPANEARPPKMGYSQNLLHHFWDRESDQMHRRKNMVHPFKQSLQYEMDMVKSLAPTLTVQNVDKPLGFLRKFTPDGKKLVAFSYDQRSLEIYQYQGVGSCAALLEPVTRECVTASDRSRYSLIVRHQMFDKIFKHKWTINLVLEHYYSRGHINREFSIFIENGRYILVAAMGLSTDNPPVQHIHEYPDLCDDFDLFFYNFYLVDLTNGTISDTCTYMHDCITLSHNHGISVHGNNIAILSRYRQCIDLFQVVDGKLVKLFVIGPRSGSIDEFCGSAAMLRSTPYDFLFHMSPLLLTHIKQRILTFLYRRAMTEKLKDESQRKDNLLRFYKFFQVYERMLMVKIQLIDSDNVLIRYEQHPNQMAWTMTGADCILQETFFLYVFYRISSARVLEVYHKNSAELLNLLKNHSDTFRNVSSMQTGRKPSSPSNDPHCRAEFESVIAAFPNGIAEAAERLNPTLPISTQSYSTSPYLDYSLFAYDNRQISALERPKACTVQPIRFCDRQTNKVRFRLWLETWTSSNFYNCFSSGTGGGDGGISSTFNFGSSNADNPAAGSSSDNSNRPNPNVTSEFLNFVSGFGGNISVSMPAGFDLSFSSILPNVVKTRRELVAFIFHPYEPFVISIQKLNSRYVVNFHIYNKSTVVRENDYYEANDSDDDELAVPSEAVDTASGSSSSRGRGNGAAQQQQGTEQLLTLHPSVPSMSPYPPRALLPRIVYQRTQTNERFSVYLGL